MYKQSKIRYVWKIEIKGEPHTVEIYTSKISYKKKVLLDGAIIYQGKQRYNSFNFQFKIGKNECQICPDQGFFELKINGLLFKQLYTAKSAGNRNSGEEQKSSSPRNMFREIKPEKTSEKTEKTWDDWERDDPFLRNSIDNQSGEFGWPSERNKENTLNA
jgi:hypothetical protein